MSFAPLLDAPLAIQLHVAAVCVAVILAPVQLIGPKGTPRHRLLGWIWVAAIVGACVSAFFILDRPIPPHVGPVSWLHLLAAFTLVRVGQAVAAARRHDVERHRRAMRAIAWLALGIPLVVAFAVPGRIMFRVVFGP
ncbi:DUF2306 domain-containing protein [Inquilinus limosus]|uniref:DUF2306 domain-containing protein n=1 Tax=Inquilinus limosus MP06 TaxID=1398085 RepID=A0A0A0D1C2_9PROT|nr:DUF2306 domain-containing protein [Inquilinus limosus]KGM31824.1 hypothetical protein P409_24970 [Inquilinus limosus MP06]